MWGSSPIFVVVLTAVAAPSIIPLLSAPKTREPHWEGHAMHESWPFPFGLQQQEHELGCNSWRGCCNSGCCSSGCLEGSSRALRCRGSRTTTTSSSSKSCATRQGGPAGCTSARLRGVRASTGASRWGVPSWPVEAMLGRAPLGSRHLRSPGPRQLQQWRWARAARAGAARARTAAAAGTRRRRRRPRVSPPPPEPHLRWHRLSRVSPSSMPWSGEPPYSLSLIHI